MKKTKKMLLGLMLCSAIALAGGVGVMVDGANDTLVTVSAEATVTETKTTVSMNAAYENGRIGFVLGQSDYNTPNQVVSLSQLESLNILTAITYNGKALKEAYSTPEDPNIYLQMWTKPNTMYFPVAQPVEGDVIKIAAGTQFPSSAFAANDMQSVYVIPYEIVYRYNGSAWIADYSNVTFAQTETNANVESYANNRLKIALSVSDYANATNNEPVYTNTDKFAAFNTLTKITVNGTPLKDVTASSEAAFLQMWGQPALWVNLPEPTEGMTVFIPAGTQFPSADFIFNGVTHCYVTTKDGTWTYDGAAWVKEIVFESTNTVASVGDYANNRLKIALSVSDYANAPNNAFTLNEEQFNALNTLTNITVNGTTLAELWNGDIAFMQMWEQPALWVPITAPTAGTVVVIPANTQFPSYAFMSGSEETCYTTTEKIAYKYDGSSWSIDYDCLTFADAETSISSVQWVANQRLMIELGTNDYGTNVENKVNVNVPASKLSATNMLEKILVNGTSLKDLGVTSADLNYWTYWGRASVALSGVEVQTITIEEGCQFPSMAFAESGTPSRYVMKESVTYYAVGEADGDVLNCKKSANVTFDGQVVTAYVGMAIPADVVPANPTKENDESYTYTFDGWYNGETKWNIDSDVVAGDMALVSKFMQELREYTVTFIADGATVGTANYTVEDKDIEEPAVPEKEGYAGAWDAYELTSGDITVNAVYTAIEYTITFVADGATVGTATYTVEDKDIEEPAVPEKEGYTGVWETYELTTGDITVNAVYTEIEIPLDPPTSEPDEPTSGEEPGTSEEPEVPGGSEKPSDSTTSEEPAEPSIMDQVKDLIPGCSGVVGGISAGVAALGIAVVALLKKKED